MPHFVVPEAGTIETQLLILGGIVVVTAIPCDLLVAFFSTRMTRWIKDNPKAQIIQNRVSGTILAAMGLFIAGEEVVNPSEQNVNP